MNHKYCDDCQLHWDTTNDGHICNGTLVRLQDSADYCIASWSFLDQESRMKVWDVNCNTAYGDNPTFSAWWSFESFCSAPGHMIAKAMNLREDQIFVEIHENKYDASLEAFDMTDPESMRERQEKIEEGYRIDAELLNIANFYEEEETFLLSSEKVL